MHRTLFTLLTVTFLTISTACVSMAQTPYSEVPTGDYVLDKAHASIIWKVSHLGLSDYTARFTDFDAKLNFDAKNPEKSSVRVTIDPASVETDYPHPEEKDFDKKLSKGKEWFNSVEFPIITFKSTKITKKSQYSGTMTGDLSFLGVTKPLTFDVTLNGAMKEHPYSKKAALGFSAKALMKRSDWGFNNYIPMIGDEVEIWIEAEFGQKTE